MKFGPACAPRWYLLIPILGVLYFCSIFAGARVFETQEATLWGITGVPAMQPPFFDTLAIATWFELADTGLDPTGPNALDPLERSMNYPPTIFVLKAAGLNLQTIPIFGVLSMALYLGSITWLARSSHGWEIVLWLLLAFSPALLLGVERANLDVAVFALLVLSAALFRQPWIAGGIIASLSLLKFFPLVALSAFFFREKKNMALAGAFWLLVGTGGIWLMRESVFTAAGSLATEHAIAFGSSVIGNYFHQPTWAVPFRIVAVILAAMAIVVGWRSASSIVDVKQGEIDFSAWMGSSIFGLLFLSGVQFDYKAIFLLLMVPWVTVVLRHTPTPLVRAAAICWCLCFVLYSHWLFFSSESFLRVFLLKQALAWCLFVLTAFFGGVLLRRVSWKTLLSNSHPSFL